MRQVKDDVIEQSPCWRRSEWSYPMTRFRATINIPIEGARVAADLTLGAAVLRANPNGNAPLVAVVEGEFDDWRLMTESARRGLTAALALGWTVSAQCEVVKAEQENPRTGPPLSLMTELSWQFRVVKDLDLLGAEADPEAIAAAVVSADEDTARLVEWFQWGLETEQRMGDSRLAVIPYAMILDSYPGKGTMEKCWGQLIKELEAKGYSPPHATSKEMCQARNAWVKAKNRDRKKAEAATIDDFRTVARGYVLLRLGVSPYRVEPRK